MIIKKTIVTTRIEVPLLKQIKKHCKKLNLTCSEYIRLLITYDLTSLDMVSKEESSLASLSELKILLN